MVASDISIIFILGSPGSGKGTLCQQLVERFPALAHFSAGDLLRAERANPDSPVAELINTTIKEGKIVPAEITIGLLKNAIESSSAKMFLIDGFPRNIHQGQLFEQQVAIKHTSQPYQHSTPLHSTPYDSAMWCRLMACCIDLSISIL
jgi:UMP-CMP kinase